MNLKQWMTAGTIVLLTGSASWAAVGTATITGTGEESDITGVLKLQDTKDGLKITGQIENIPPGEHAFHIHEFGDCGDDGKNAGGHFNPDGHQHGNAIKDGIAKAHAGDMGNLTFNEEGTATVNATVPGITLAGGKYSVGGRGIVVHEKKDDFGQPVGNAGGRIACGPIVITGK